MKHLSILIAAPVLLALSACSEKPAGPLFNACFAHGMEQGKGESDQKAVEAGVTKVCNMFVTECDENPDSEMCQSVKKKFGVEGK